MKTTMKRIFAAILVLTFLSGCAAGAPTAQGTMKRWLEAAQLDAAETPEELYKAALEEDTLVVYTISSRILKVKESFEKQYPGLTVEVRDVRTDDMREYLQKNYDEQTFDCDVAVYSDNIGIMAEEFAAKGIVYKYIPYDMKDVIIGAETEPLLGYTNELQQLFYNSAVYDRCPVKNWWELTEEAYRGRVCIPDPWRIDTSLAWLLAIQGDNEYMAKAYLARYGEELSLPEGTTAGQVFLERLMENDMIVTNYYEEVINLIGQSDKPNPPVGIVLSSKLRQRDLGYDILPAYGLESFDAVFTPVHVMLVGGGKNTNAAKLFIRWLLGEADGTGEGSVPYMTEGAWPCRTDVKGVPEMPFSDISLLPYDISYLYKNKDTFLKTWLRWQEGEAAAPPESK